MEVTDPSRAFSTGPYCIDSEAYRVLKSACSSCVAIYLRKVVIVSNSLEESAMWLDAAPQLGAEQQQPTHTLPPWKQHVGGPSWSA